MPKIKSIISTFLIFLSLVTYSQGDIYSSSSIPIELKSNANAVVRYDKSTIEIINYDELLVASKRVVTIFNDKGDRHQNAFESYDENTSIKKMEVHIYNDSGDEIKKFKKNDFVDVSAISGGTLYSDSRVKYLDYTPLEYPYTIEYVSEVEYSNTSYISSWQPIDDYYLSVQSSEFIIKNDVNEKINLKKENFEEYNIEEMDDLHFKAENLVALKHESYSPEISRYTPKLSVSLDKFMISGVAGTNKNWESQGKWMYENLIKTKSNLSDATKEKVRLLVKDIEDPIEKAKKVYEYVQANTRYISVQEGIGGMQPISSNEVDDVKYGDCKGLSNYTKDLLSAVGVESYYTRLYASRSPKDVDKNFVSFQGQTNHVILAIPHNEDYIWLECTSQTNPFGFIAGFTDDRDVLVVKPDGGEIVHTKIYNAEDSVQETKAEIAINETGGFDADVSVKTTGFQYSLHEGLESETLIDQELHYKQYWDNINDISIDKISLENDKESVVYTEEVKLSSSSYASKSGNRLILQPNMFNKVSKIPTRYTDRKLDFEIDRSFKDIDEFIIYLPESFQLEAMSEGESIESKFGTYQFKLESIGDKKIKYTRIFTMLKGNYDKQDYKAFRDFRKQVVRYDKTKIVLVKT